MNTRNTREENKESRENSGEIRKQIYLHLLFEESILLLVLLSFLWCFSMCEPPSFRLKCVLFIEHVI